MLMMNERSGMEVADKRAEWSGGIEEEALNARRQRAAKGWFENWLRLAADGIIS